MQLYWYWSFNPQKAQLALEECGFEYELVHVDLNRGEQKRPEFRQVNPRGQVPVLSDEGFNLCESHAILTYLGEKSGRFWPTGLEARATATAWLFFLSSSLELHVGKMWFNEYVAKRFGFKGDTEAVELGRKSLKRPMGHLNRHLSDNEFMCGEFCLVDCALGPVLAALDLTSFNWEPYEQVSRYLGRLRQRSAWQKCEIDQPPVVSDTP